MYDEVVLSVFTAELPSQLLKKTIEATIQGLVSDAARQLLAEEQANSNGPPIRMPPAVRLALAALVWMVLIR